MVHGIGCEWDPAVSPSAHYSVHAYKDYVINHIHIECLQVAFYCGNLTQTRFPFSTAVQEAANKM